MRKIATLAVALVMTLSMAGMAQAKAPKQVKNCNGTYQNVTLKSVTVRSGSSCTLKNVVVTGGVHAMKGAVNLYVLDSTVGRNIQANGVRNNVVIGQSGCKYDPTVGNNVHVTNSHNVLICWVSAKNNIMVTANDGRVTVRDSVAGNNINVTRNRAYISDGNDTDHNHPEWVRVLRNKYGNHLFVTNKERPRTVVRGNTLS